MNKNDVYILKSKTKQKKKKKKKVISRFWKYKLYIAFP